MHRIEIEAARAWRPANGALRDLAAALALLVSAGAWAQITISQAAPATPAAPVHTLQQAFDAAWSRQPDAHALPARRDAARAAQQAAQGWTPAPAALELSGKTDRPGRRQGAREYELGVAVPIWLPGERAHSATLADAEAGALESRATAAQLQVAAAVRDAWWAWQRARLDTDTARAQLDNARRLAADVARRTRAGDLARADQHQADGALAAAESALAQAEAAGIGARQALRALTGSNVSSESSGPGLDTAPGTAPTAEPEPPDAPFDVDAHAALAALRDRVRVADGSVALVAAQTRANPELVLATTRDRGGYGEPYQQTVTLGVRIPFGAGARQEVRLNSARADGSEAQAQLAFERERLLAEHDSAAARVAAARAQLAAAQRRAQLARETRGFFDKSFRLGETDLPTRLRIEAEAVEAERQEARARIDAAAAVSLRRQALGLLPR